MVATAPSSRQAPGVVGVTTSATTAELGPIVLGSTALGAGGLGGPGYEVGGNVYALKIQSDDGNDLNAVSVFDKVNAFWTSFLSHHGLL